MLATYRAVLHGNQLEWIDEVPDQVANATSIRVHITILESQQPSAQVEERGKQMAAALERLAQLGGLSQIEEPTLWERQARQDRRLPSRDD